jgi:hypothetical protein
VFLLTNEQRKYFGITSVPSSWDLVKLIPSPYDKHDTFVYFDINTIRKRITVGENSYMEYDLNEEASNDRTVLLPKTEKGKTVKLTASNIEKRTSKGMYFSYHDGYVRFGNCETNKTFYDSSIDEIKLKNFTELSYWIEQWISDSTISDLNEIAKFSSELKKHCKFQEGDFFRFKLNRRLFGYGRILLNYDQMRKEKIKFWDILMGKPLVAKVYHIATTDKNVVCENLKELKALPSTFIMDNPFFYGEYEIIGNLPLSRSDLDFPVMYGKSIDARDMNKILLQSGPKYFELSNESNALFPGFRNNGIGWSLYVKLSILKKCIQLQSNDPYWEQNNYTTNNDLRNPKFFAERKAICKQFNVKEEDIFLTV